VSNAIRHGGPGGDVIRLAIRVTSEWLEVVMRETGPRFDFDGYEMPDVEAVAPDAIPEGGFGIPLIKSGMDVAEYRHEGGTNILRLAKRRDGAPAGARR
jgi:anti-sigma regulatory factor (Ser/Thr protein kinase)